MSLRVPRMRDAAISVVHRGQTPEIETFDAASRSARADLQRGVVARADRLQIPIRMAAVTVS